jgi:4-carboxymuconolactone decarboxylase
MMISGFDHHSGASRIGFAILLSIFCARAEAQNRLPLIPPDNLSAEQKREVEVFKHARTPFGERITDNVTGPFQTLMRSPKLMNRVRGVGDYVRWESILPKKVNELIAIITAREWTSPYVWSAIYRQALEAGVNPDVVKAVTEGRRPRQMTEEEEIAYDFTLELQRHQSVSDATYARALAKFGEQGVIDMVGVTGYYTFLSMVQNMARVGAPANSTAPRITGFPSIER